MIKRFLPLSILCLWSVMAMAQLPNAPVMKGYHAYNGPDVRMCSSTNWVAGTSMQALDPAAQSNNVEFLCLNDALNITHDGNFSLDPTEDPDATTAPGIHYAFYECAPANTGPDIDNISSDPCIFYEPAILPSLEEFYLTDNSVINVNGTGTFTNTGGLQTAFNGGDPLELFFIPITVHDHALPGYETFGNNEYCVNATPSDVFRVVYLNAITEANINNNVGNSCTGSFDIAGGLPQFDALNGSNSNFTITIEQNGNPAITGTVTSGAATHNSTVTFTVPGPGMYDVTVEDGVSCGASFSVDMTACSAAVSATYTANPTTCNGSTDGSIVVDITPGAPGYTIEWQLQPGGAVQSGNLPAGTQFTIPNLAPGTYGVTVTDNVSSQDIGTATVAEPPALGASLVNLIQPTCNGESTGSISVEVSVGGVVIIPDNTYTFDWGLAQATQTITNVPSGPYAVTVTDGNGCTATASATLSQPAAITAPPLTAVDASCLGVADGSATIMASGGTGTLDYAWSTTPEQNTATASNIEPGTYTVTVTDDNNCVYTDNVTVGAATVLTASAAPTDVSCNGQADGQITVTENVVGVDNGGYTYVWNPNAGATATVTSLTANTYTVTVTDANGCSATADAVINEPTVLTVMATAANESCAVGNDGSVSTTVMGGTPLPGGTYNYTWSNTGTTDAITGLSGGTYTVTVTDANNCTATAEGVVNAPNGPTIVDFTIVGVQCATDMNGSLTVNAVEGNDPITGYAWSNGPTTPNNDNLGPGTYTVTVTDGGGCQTTAQETITAPAALAENTPAATTTPFCPGGGEGTITLDITGGIAPYNYNWSNGSTGPAFDVLTNLIADTYTVTVTDANSCTFIVSDIVVNDPPAINVIFQDIQPVSCFAGIPCDGGATVVASGGLSTNYTFTWSSGETSTGGSSTATQLCQGNQTVTVTDGFCTEVFDMSANPVPAPPIVSIQDIQTTDVTCFGDTDGSATITPTGGDGGPYTIVWSNGDVGPTANNLAPNNNYSVSITDGLGCESVPFTITVGEPQPLQLVVIDTIDITCNGDGDGIIQVAPVGGNQGTFTYQWSPNTSNTLNVATGLSAGIYSVTVTDQNGCSATVSADVDEPEPIIFEYTDPEEPVCNGFTTVFGLDTVYGGAGVPYTYTIDGFNFQSTNQASPILAGTYTIEVTDASGCSASEELVVDEPAPIIVDLGDDVEIQLGESYEIVPAITPLGALDSLVWSPAIGLDCTDCFNPTASPLEDQVYTLTVIDENGCFGSDDLLVDIDPNRNVYIPNIFTPNNDGINDFFSPFIGVGVENINSIMIFDRWGEMVYMARDFVPDGIGNNGWDGRLDGKVMNNAVFIYVIEVAFIDGEVLTYKGDVTLLN